MTNQVKIKITGKNPNYFIKELIKQKINIYYISSKAHEAIIIINYEDYKNLIKLKTTYKIEIIQYLGINKYKFLIKNNLIFITFFIFAIIVNIFLSNLIFEIEIVHPNREIIEIVNNNLKYNGIKKYNFKVSFTKKEKIIASILKKEVDNLEWLEIEEQGTKYIVKVEQRRKNTAQLQCTPRNIVAKKDARIVSIAATKGEVVTKINDYVHKNDILISGFIHNKEDIVSKKCATGVVYGEVWYKIKITLPKNYQEETLTGKKSIGFQINFFNKEINLFTNYKTKKVKNIPLIKDNLLPININFTHYFETKVKKENYTLENASLKALKIASKKIKDQLSTNESIISKKVLKKEQNNSKIYIEVFMKVKEDITKYQDISNIDIEKKEPEE